MHHDCTINSAAVTLGFQYHFAAPITGIFIEAQQDVRLNVAVCFCLIWTSDRCCSHREKIIPFTRSTAPSPSQGPWGAPGTLRRPPARADQAQRSLSLRSRYFNSANLTKHTLQCGAGEAILENKKMHSNHLLYEGDLSKRGNCRVNNGMIVLGHY